MNPDTRLSSVVLPEPLDPMTAVIFPGSARSVTPPSAWTPPKAMATSSITTACPGSDPRSPMRIGTGSVTAPPAPTTAPAVAPTAAPPAGWPSSPLVR